jgi:Mechanosensitive ion channel MscS, C-terminal/Mechanosensitive ion channel, beta-domain
VNLTRFRWIHLLGLFLLVSGAYGNAAEEGTANPSKTGARQSSTTTPVPPAVIPLEEVASQAMQVDTLIRGFATNVPDTHEVETIDRFVPQVHANLALELKNTTKAVQVGNLQGRVRRTGIRASTIRTGQGAEMIVPNTNLITQEVTNWTLTDKLRRLDLPVGVNYGSAPTKVIELLEGVAGAHPKVLKQPAPRCLFMSYGDSSINFELRVWTEYSILSRFTAI